MSMSKSNATNSVATSPVEATFTSGASGPFCVADGMGLSIRVDRGHLIVTDGIGRHRRERRYHKATHGLSRLVILGSTGTLSLDALRYCDRLGIPVAVVDASSSRVSFTSAPAGTDDARLRRVQALAPDTGFGLEIARMLLKSKLEEQAKVLRAKLGADETAEVVMTLSEQLGYVFTHDEMREFEASAAACYFNAWNKSGLVVPQFIAKDRGRVPEHWRRFDGRRSVLHAKNEPQGRAAGERHPQLPLRPRGGRVDPRLSCHGARSGPRHHPPRCEEPPVNGPRPDGAGAPHRRSLDPRPSGQPVLQAKRLHGDLRWPREAPAAPSPTSWLAQ